MERGADRVVFFSVGAEGQRQEAAQFDTLTSPEELKELFRSAAEASPRDILKLYNASGHLVNISPALEPNTPDTRYKLEVVAAHCNGMLLDEVGIDLLALEERVSKLEKQLHVECDELPPTVQDLKQQVDQFRAKLETTEHLSWLGFYKELPPPLSTEACRMLQYRRKSDTQKQRVRDNFFNICDVAVSENVRHWLRRPSFDSCQWEDEEILLLLQQMFLDLNLTTKFSIQLPVLRNFLYEVYKNYNEVPFHNFRHCFCVAQMMYAMVWCVDLPSKIGDLETLILLTSCICHDLDHLGYNNIYQINAKTELALRYNDISPLENHHCSVAFRVLENPDCNILQSLPGDVFRQVREGIIRCILATDMARHNEILAQFKDVTPEFDYKNKTHTNLLCMVLIKVADISNEARPMDVAEPWLDRLLQEFFKQSDAEKLEGLPVTPFMDREKITKPSSQCSFIGFVLLPLFEALGELLIELQGMIVQPVRDALEYYRRLNEAAKDERMHRKSVVDALELGSSDSMISPGDASRTVMVKSMSTHSVKSRRSLPTIQSRSRSRSAEEDEPPLEGLDELMSEVEEHEDDETATEVEVSEKTLKFKIATEGNVGGRKSYPGSRKGSREKTQLQEYGHTELARAVREQQERERRRSEASLMGRRLASPVPSDGDICNGSTRLHNLLETQDDSEQLDKCTEEKECGKSDNLEEAEQKCIDTVGRECSKSELHNHKSPSFLSRLRNFTDRLSFSTSYEKHSDAKVIQNTKHYNSSTKSTSASSECSPTGPKLVGKGQPSVQGNSLSTSNGGEDGPPSPDDGRRAMTLPKMKKPQRQNTGRKGWRALIGNSKSDLPTSSVEALPPSEPLHPLTSDEKRNQFLNKRNSCTSAEGSKTVRKICSEASTQINTHLQKANKGGSSLEEKFLGDHDAISEPVKLTGSLDSILQEREKVGNNNNRKKVTALWSSPNTKRSGGLLARLSRLSVDDAGPDTPTPSKVQVHQQNWMASLAASFRARRSQAQDVSKQASCEADWRR